MRIKSQNLKIFFQLSGAIILLAFLISCGTTEPTSVSIPTLIPTMTVTDTPEPPTATPEPESEQGAEGLLLPSATARPTATPGVITDLVGNFVTSAGLNEKTILGLDIEDWINLAVSIFMALVTGLLLSRLVKSIQ